MLEKAQYNKHKTRTTKANLEVDCPIILQATNRHKLKRVALRWCIICHSSVQVQRRGKTITKINHRHCNKLDRARIQVLLV